MNVPLTTEQIVRCLVRGGWAGQPGLHGRLSSLCLPDFRKALNLTMDDDQFDELLEHEKAVLYVRGALAVMKLSDAERASLELALAEVSL